MKVKVNKLWLGKYVSVRDYMAKKCINKGEDLEIIHGDESMIIPLSQIAEGRLNQDEFISKIDKKKYKLIDYSWKPTRIQKLF